MKDCLRIENSKVEMDVTEEEIMVVNADSGTCSTTKVKSVTVINEEISPATCSVDRTSPYVKRRKTNFELILN